MRWCSHETFHEIVEESAQQQAFEGNTLTMRWCSHETFHELVEKSAQQQAFEGKHNDNEVVQS